MKLQTVERELVNSYPQRRRILFTDVSFEDALHWFLLSTSIMRYRKYKKPISMLVHTSQKQLHHQVFADLINNYFRNTSKVKIIESCRELYARGE